MTWFFIVDANLPIALARTIAALEAGEMLIEVR
jgi:hypothetical protein